MSSNTEQGKVTLYDWRPFFRAVAQKLYEIGQQGPEARDTKMREIAEKIFIKEDGSQHKITSYPKVDPLSIIYTLSGKLAKNRTGQNFAYLKQAFVALKLDEHADPKDITDVEYPRYPRANSFFHDNGSYVEKNLPKPPDPEDLDEQEALNSLWELFNKTYTAKEYVLVKDTGFREAIKHPRFGLVKLTHVMFLINPDVFLPIDDRTLWLPLFPEVEHRLRLHPKQKAQDIMKERIEAEDETFSGIMQKITGAFPGCKPYEINLFAWLLQNNELYIDDLRPHAGNTWKISTQREGEHNRNYWPEFHEKSHVQTGGPTSANGTPYPYPHPKRGQYMLARTGGTLHALGVILQNTYKQDDWQWEDYIQVVWICVKDAKIHYLGDALEHHKQGINFNDPTYQYTNTLLHKIRDKQKGRREIKEKCPEEIALLEANKNLVLTGPPGTGKTHIAKELATEYFDECHFVQFHPSYDYTDFVEGLRPVKQEGQKDIDFKLVDGTFMKFCMKAEADTSNSYVFVIDEINRGEISKIFGELFFSIESGYRGKAGGVQTQYYNMRKDRTHAYGDDMGDLFYVPDNVYIIGTMNDIDRSVESIDFAMRRRFAWKRISYDDKNSIGMLYDKLEKEDAEKAEARLTRLNEAIAPSEDSTKDGIATEGSTKDDGIDGLNADYHIGAAYMLKVGQYRTDGKKWEKLWDYHLKPLLREYLRGLPKAEEKLKELKEAYDKDKA